MSTTDFNTNFVIHDLILNRKSIRAFAPKPVEHDKLMRLLEAARWAPSASNEQPWRFVVISKDNADLFDAVVRIFVPFYLDWARSAAVLIVAIGRMAWESDGAANPFWEYDLGQCVAYLTIAAEADGLVSGQIGAFNPDRVRQVLEVPAGYKPLTIIALGYPQEPSTNTNEEAKQEGSARTRKSLDEIVFEGRWGISQPAQRREI